MTINIFKAKSIQNDKSFKNDPITTEIIRNSLNSAA